MKETPEFFPDAPPMEFEGLAGYQEIMAFRGRPQPPQSVEARAGSLETTIFWTAPQNMEGIAAWRVFKDDENKLVSPDLDVNTKRFAAKMPGDGSAMFYVCSVSELGRESPKVPVFAQSNTDKLVATGTAGSTAGSVSAPATEWTEQPRGGRYERMLR